jgi:hypothetical protein
LKQVKKSGSKKKISTVKKALIADSIKIEKPPNPLKAYKEDFHAYKLQNLNKQNKK